MWYNVLMINIGERVVSVRKDKNLRQNELARRAGMSAAQLCQIENGRVRPTFDMVERLATALDITIYELIEGQPARRCTSSGKPAVERETNVTARLPYIVIRSLERDAKSVLRQIAVFEQERDALEDARHLAGSCTFALNRARPNYQGAGVAMADELRADLGLGTAPIVDLATVLEFRGVRIYFAKLPKSVGSVSLWNCKRETAVIVLNNRNTAERQRYRLAYELGSICLFVSLGKSPLDEDLVQHRFLTDFTAEFLMPAVTVRLAVASTGLRPEDWTFEELIALKYRFNVSAESFALRLEELGLIVPSLRLNFRDQLRAYYKKHPKAMEPQPRGRKG